jgi:Ca2+-transporting ATPase
VTVILSLALLWPFARDLFRFGPLHLDDIAVTIGAGVVTLLLLEILKPVLTGRQRN